ncbi:ABC transporter substrate-binding protein [Sphingobium lactosutens]|uniref:substrate-binding periplasmic protein n=1 Tax=Sphingobium lactosutens TaxID=522773 RepID=UPI0015B9E2A5|nr:transporter substrate-binding domain-containing protein [Sphingobium lactosutens]NWK96428.1 ABC transporter substrate-binding protein [Sphingobium lactosutens]
MLSRRALLQGAGAMAVAGAFPALAPNPAGAAPLARVRELGTLRVAVYRDNRPWSWEKDGKLVGIDVDLAKALASKLNLRADVAQITADESVDDDLRNAVWKGGLLGFMPADIMLHIPFDRTFAARNDQVAIIAPYYRETFQFAGRHDDIDCDAPPVQWKGKRLAAELDSIPDFYLIGAFGGALSKDVTHYMSGAEAVNAMIDGKADGVLASRAQIEAVLHERGAGGVARRKMPLPAFTSAGWDIGLAVKENSRTLGDAIEEIMSGMVSSGEMQALFAAHGVTYMAPVAAG